MIENKLNKDFFRHGTNYEKRKSLNKYFYFQIQLGERRI